MRLAPQRLPALAQAPRASLRVRRSSPPPPPLPDVPALDDNTVTAGLPVLPRASLGADGLLGIDVLKGRRIRLNFARNTF